LQDIDEEPDNVVRRSAGFWLASLARKNMDGCTTHCRNRLPPSKLDQGVNCLFIEGQVIESASSAPTGIWVSVAQGFKEFRTFWHSQPPGATGERLAHQAPPMRLVFVVTMVSTSKEMLTRKPRQADVSDPARVN
jgi:hypothetical protein